MTRITVFGYPGTIGGADTELWHVLKLWRRFDLSLRLVPTWEADPTIRSRCDSLGIETVILPDESAVPDLPDLRRDLIVSLCNGEFLRCSPVLRLLGCRLIWVNCMNWIFPPERLLSGAYGPFDAYVFQSAYQMRKLSAPYESIGVRADKCHRVSGAFDTNEFAFAPRRRSKGDTFFVGRMARPDLDKWCDRTWRVYGAIPSCRVQCRMMGCDHRVVRKLGLVPPWAEVLPPCAEPVEHFLGTLHCLMPINGGAEENWPRVGLEAMATGVPIVTENKWGWQEMIEHGRTGYLADTDAELAEYAGRLAADEKHRLWIARNARERLVDELANPNVIWRQWQQVFEAML